jgi:hypothetical protein
MGKSGSFDCQLVIVGQQCRRLKKSLLVCHHVPDCTSAGGIQLDGSRRHPQVLQIADNSCDNAIVALTECEKSEDYATQQDPNRLHQLDSPKELRIAYRHVPASRALVNS